MRHFFTLPALLCKNIIAPYKGSKNIRYAHNKNASFFIYYMAKWSFYIFLTNKRHKGAAPL